MMDEARGGLRGEGNGGDVDGRIVRALERQPRVNVSADFAARFAGLAKPMAAPPRGVGVGRRVALVAAGLLLAWIFALAHSGGGGARAGQWLEAGLALEFSGLAAWLALRIV